jgi:membrane protease YdiL (CAAX protease family)
MLAVNKSQKVKDFQTRDLVFFVCLTFGISWGVIGMFVVFPEWASSLFGEISGSHPLFFLATWAPAISAVVLVLYRAGLRGLTGFFGRLLQWRAPKVWVFFCLLAIPGIYMVGSALKGGGVLAPIPPAGAGVLVGTLFTMLFLGPVEELGWRGFAQPLLQRHFAPIVAGAIIGSIWGLWHLPVFFLSGMVFSSWSFLPFFIGNITLAVLVTPLFNKTNGSLLWPMLFHWQLINPFWPEAQPLDTWLFLAVTLVVVWWHKDTMFRRGDTVTSVIPNEA